jgi:hypothetical protein
MSSSNSVFISYYLVPVEHRLTPLLRKLIQPFSHFSMWNSIVILYCILFTLYGVFSLWSFWRAVQDAFKMKQFFEDRLGISDQRLEGGAVDWDRDVVAKLN